MDGQAISIILDGEKSQWDQIPNSWLSNMCPDIKFTIEHIADRFNIHNAYVQPKLVLFGTDSGDAEVYYTILCPKEFLNEEALSKLSNNFEKLSEQDRVAIRQSLSILPY